jgi:SlyX protein
LVVTLANHRYDWGLTAGHSWREMTETNTSPDLYSLEAQIVDLQTRLVFAEEAHAELDDIVARQDVMIRELKRQIDELRGELESASAQWGETNVVERPPHY